MLRCSGWVGHAKPGDQRRIIDLEDKPRFNHGFVVALAEVGQGIEIRLFRLVILVPEEVGYPPWAEQGKKIIYVCTGGRDAPSPRFVLDRWAPGRQGLVTTDASPTGTSRRASGYSPAS